MDNSNDNMDNNDDVDNNNNDMDNNDDNNIPSSTFITRDESNTEEMM